MKATILSFISLMLAPLVLFHEAQAQCVQNQGALTTELLIDGGNSDGTFTYVWGVTFNNQTTWVTDLWFQSAGAAVTSPKVLPEYSTWFYTQVASAPGTGLPAEYFQYQTGLKLQRNRTFTFAYTTSFTDPVQVRARDNVGNTYTTSFTSSACGNLPVELTAFEVRTDDGRAVAMWETASETNNAGFALQMRPEAARTFTTLGFVAGAGTTAEAQRYRYETTSLAPGRYVFRLQQVDFDGAEAYGPEVALEIAPEGPLFVAPFQRVVQGDVQVRFSTARADHVRAQLFNVLGQQVGVVFDGDVATGETVDATLETTGLSAGVYFLRFQGQSFQYTERVTVVR